MKHLLVLAPCIMLSACAYNQHNREHSTGVAVSQQQIAALEIGTTNRQSLLTQWGIPDRTQQEKDGVEVFEYIRERTEKSEKSFIFLFNLDSDKVTERKVTRVVLRNGLVVSVNTSDA